MSALVETPTPLILNHPLELIKEITSEEEEKNKPECKICLEKVDFKDINILECGHIYHPICMNFYIKALIEEKNFPICCPEPECKQALIDEDIQIF
mmetsp:Transcript_6232/g.6987  ORF Transcript_6232/g.6987 Transcript_6232/m.6987 type:complete len:96 (+) Transcript_6232:550-837(+)